MGRYKKELKKIHRKKIRKAKEKVKAYLKKEIGYDKLTSLAKRLLAKRKRFTKTT